MTPGWKSSECWMLVFAKLLSAAVALGLVSTTQADDLSGNAAKLAAGVAAIVWFMGAAKNYANNRHQQKVTALTLDAAQAKLPAASLQSVADIVQAKAGLSGIVAVLLGLCLAGTAPAQQGFT